jgi:hypothetical protein
MTYFVKHRDNFNYLGVFDPSKDIYRRVRNIVIIEGYPVTVQSR